MMCCSFPPTDSLEDSDYQEVSTLLAQHAQALSPEVTTIIAWAFRQVKKRSNPPIVNESPKDESNTELKDCSGSR